LRSNNKKGVEQSTFQSLRIRLPRALPIRLIRCEACECPSRDAPVAKRSGWVSAKRELRSSRQAPRDGPPASVIPCQCIRPDALLYVKSCRECATATPCCLRRSGAYPHLVPRSLLLGVKTRNHEIHQIHERGDKVTVLGQSTLRTKNIIVPIALNVTYLLKYGWRRRKPESPAGGKVSADGEE